MLYILALLTIALLCLLDYKKRQYWSRRNVKHIAPLPFFGNSLPVVTQKGTPVDVYAEALQQGKDQPYVGVYEFWRPTLIINNKELVERIMIKDFSNFLNHPRWIFDKKSFLHDSLFNMKGNKWRAYRYQTVPWFTTGRMKAIFEDVLNCIYKPKDVFELLTYARYVSADATAAFLGVQIRDREQFLNINDKAHEVSHLRYYRLLLVEHFSSLADRVGITFTDDYIDKFYRTFLKYVLANENFSLAQRCQNLLKNKEIHMRKKDLYAKSTEEGKFSFEVTEDALLNIVGQFLFAGLDTTSLGMVWLLYELAANPEVQSIARQEIRSVLEKHGGWTYDAVHDMKYVAKMVHESMRMHPTLPFLFRDCTTKYTTPDGLVIDEGTKIVIPSFMIHNDPTIYLEPEKFKPERFASVNKQTNLEWLTFGEGPRKCTGIRFALMLSRTMVARILENHSVTLANNITQPPVLNNRSFFNRPQEKIFIKLEEVAA